MKNPIFAITSLILVASLNMGNKGCSTPGSTSGRVLAMDTEIGAMTAKRVTLPTGEVVDFPYIVNAMFFNQVMESNQLRVANLVNQSSAPAQTLAEVRMLHKFNLVNSAEDDSNKCMYRSPRFHLDGAIVDFSASAGGGLDIGYGVNPSTAIGVGVDYSQTTLDLTMLVSSPLSHRALAPGSKKATQKNISGHLGYGMLGFDFFFKSGISDAVGEAIDGAIADIVAKYSAVEGSDWNHAWESRIMYCQSQSCDSDTHFAIRGGAENGIKKGDTFTITNMTSQWSDPAKPCASALDFEVPDDPENPTAYGIVEDIEDDISVIKITKNVTNTRIRFGARVKLDQFVVDESQATTR